MNRLNLKNLFLTMALVLVTILGLKAAIQFENLNNATDPIIDINQKNGPANSVYATWGDYDLDGDEDLYVVNNGSPNHLYRNNTCSYDLPCESISPAIAATHPTSFTKMTSAENPGLAVLRDGVSASKFAHWVDYDQDGDLDLYVVNDGMNRLFINELFDPSKPYDPFSRFPVKSQALNIDKFSYKAHPEVKLAMGSEDFMQVVTTVTIPSTVNYPKSGTNDILEDFTVDYLQVSPQVVPGMYLEISQAADPAVIGRIYTILEVIGPNQLRLDYEQDLQAIFQYRILRDTKAQLINTERFINEFETEGTVISDSLVYEYSGSNATFSLVDRQIADGDQVILNSTANIAARTLSTLIQVDPRSFTVSPPTEINGQPLMQGIEMNVRRRGGEILVQKIITDRRVGFPIQTISPGDEIEIVSGVNKNSRYVVEQVFGQDVIFLKSDAGTTPMTSTIEEFEYEIIYNRINSTTRRILTDRGASFGLPAYRIEAGNDANTRQVKIGDYIIINPEMNIGAFGEANAGQSAETALGVRTTFDDGTARPPGILEIKDILDPGVEVAGGNDPGSKQIVVDAFPSEVVTGYRNDNFPYQIRHRFGQLQVDALSGEIKFFTEVAPNGPVIPRNFNLSLGINLFPNSPQNPAILITDALPNAIGNQGVTLRPDSFKGAAVNGYIRTKIELLEAVDPAAFTTTTGLEYRPVYYSLGTQNPYANPRVLRVFSQQLPSGVASGHFLVLRGFVDNDGFEVRLNKTIRVIEAQEGIGVVDLFLIEDMPEELLLDFKELCNDSGQCDTTEGATESQEIFFSAPENQLSVRYEFVATNALDAGVQLDLKVEGEVSIATSGLQYNLLTLTSGDSLEYKDPLTGSIRSSEIATFSSGTIAVLTNTNALVPPFNTDIPVGVTGFKPVYRGLLTDFRTITSSNPMMNFTSIAHPLDKISFFSVVPNQGLSLVARVPIGTVTSTFIQLKRRLTLDPALQSFSPEDFQTNPFYFRVTRSSGNLAVRGTFKDSRQGLDFTRNLSLNPDGTLRGLALLDLYKTSTNVTDPLYKRFVLSDILSVNRIGLLSGAVDQDNDIFNNYFYEVNQLFRDQGGIIENHTGNGRKVEFADWNKDGVKDIYILNSADNAADLNSNDPETSALDQNSSQMYYGTTLSGISTGIKYMLPEVIPADNENDLRNLRTLITELANPLEPRAVLSSDLNDDLEPDLLILNVDESDKLLLSGVTEAAINRELNSKPENGLLFAPIFAENDVVIGDVNQDGTQDIYYLVGRDPDDPVAAAAQVGAQQITSNVLFLTSATVGSAEPIFTAVGLPILDPNVALMEGGYSLSGAILDYNNDGYADINVMNNDLIYLAEMRFEGANSVGNSDISLPANCGPSGPGYNRHIAWTDANMDGWPDYYVSRASDTGETNALCIAVPDQTEIDSNNYFIVDLIPRNLTGRTDKIIKLARVTMLYDDQALQQKAVNQTFEYNYPFPTVVKFSSGPVQKATFIVEWPDQHLFNYGEFSSTNTSGSRIKLEQPGDFYISNNKNLTSVQSSPLSTIQTTVGPQTTNVEATGFTIMAGRREPILLENLSVFFSGGFIFENPADVSANFVPSGSIKLYLDASEVDQNSDDFKSFTPDGRLDVNHDVEIASGPLLVYSISGGPTQPNQQENLIVYNDILGNDGTVKGPETVKIGALFQNLNYRSRDGTTTTSFILNPSLDSDLPDRLSFIVVYTVDIRQDSEFANPNTKLQILPYIPKRIYQGSLNILAQAGEQTAAIINNPFEQSFEVQLRGQNSSQLNRGILLDETSLGSNSMTIFSTFPFNNLPKLTTNLVGRMATIDQIAPVKPTLDANVITTLKETSVLLFGTAEQRTTIRINNITAGTEPVFTDVLSDGTWQILVTGLAEGDNQLALVSVDFYGNESLETVADISVDLTPPNISQEIVTNIGIAKATITWNTDESAVGTVYLTSPSMPSVEQSFQAEDQFLFRTEHSIAMGESNNMYLSLALNETPPTVPNPAQCQGNSPAVGSAIPQVAALCPDTTYNVSIEVKDNLGNIRRINNIVSFTTLPTRSTNPNDPDQDSDGDGIPDIIEADTERFPDLDMFDNNDALLDFDEDGVNNVEEYSSGFDMYNPFDVLPIANAGIDRTVDPGIIILDSSASNQNGISTNNLSFRWVMESAPNQRIEAEPPSPPEIDNSNAQRTYFTARKAGTYVVSLQILTFQGAESKKDTVNYFVRNIEPKANAGADSIGQISQDIVLDGRSTSDSNGDPLTYRWIQLQGPILSSLGNEFGIEDENSARTTFRTNRTGKYVFELVVRDSFNALSRDKVTVLVNSEVDVFPIADAGDDLVGTQGNAVTLEGDRSGGINSSAVLEYAWELITSATQDVPEECEDFRTTNVTAVSTTASTLKNPRIVFTEPGIYAFKLTVNEQGKGLESAPDCFKVIINKQDEPLPISRPEVFGEPVRVSDRLAGVVSQVSPSLAKEADEAISVYRVPINYEVQLSGIDSFPSHDVIASKTAGSNSITQLNADENCIDQTTVYSWRQITGDKLTLNPQVPDCSVVKFIPIHVGIYTFGLKVRNDIDGQLVEGMERTIVIIANDNFNEEDNTLIAGVENDFIPSIVAPDSTVITAGSNLTFPSPSCMDQDLMASASTVAEPFAPNNIPINELKSCGSTPPLSCVWSQINGPTLNIENPNICSPTFLNVQEGTYTVSVRAFDGEFYSLSSETTFVAVGINKAVPQANAGSDRVGTIDQSVYLDGSLSIAETNQFDYLWKQVGGMPVALLESRTVSPRFIPPAQDTYTFQLQVQNNSGIRSLPDLVDVFVPSTSISNVNQNDGSGGNQASADPVVQGQIFEQQGGGGGGGCFIATATSGANDSFLVKRLTSFRDTFLVNFELGRLFVKNYYKYSPAIASKIENNSILRVLCGLFLYPLAFIVELSLFAFILLMVAGIRRRRF